MQISKEWTVEQNIEYEPTVHSNETIFNMIQRDCLPTNEKSVIFKIFFFFGELLHRAFGGGVNTLKFSLFLIKKLCLTDQTTYNIVHRSHRLFYGVCLCVLELGCVLVKSCLKLLPKQSFCSFVLINNDRIFIFR